MLLFDNFSFKAGENLTVRRGTKWQSEKPDSEYGYYLGSTKDPSKILGFAGFNKTKALPFNAIKDEDLVDEHDPNCRTYSGLLKGMKEIYPDFDEREIVTLIYFEYLLDS